MFQAGTPARDLRRRYNGAAERWHDRITALGYGDAYRAAICALIPATSRPQRVMDVGCGAGSFAHHYLLYALDGLMRLEADGRCWILPSARAAWIAANEPINVRIDRRISGCSIMFSSDAYAGPSHPLRVFDMTPLLREVMLALRPYGPDRTDLPAHARQMFDLAASLAEQLSANPSRAWMPTVRSDVLRRALEITKANLATAQSFEDVAGAAGTTPRTLARRFSDELGMTWRQAQRRLRMVHAVEVLSEDRVSITEVAFATGYNSLSAFNAAFRDFMGQTPSDYRRSMRADA